MYSFKEFMIHKNDNLYIENIIHFVLENFQPVLLWEAEGYKVDMENWGDVFRHLISKQTSGNVEWKHLLNLISGKNKGVFDKMTNDSMDDYMRHYGNEGMIDPSNPVQTPKEKEMQKTAQNHFIQYVVSNIIPSLRNMSVKSTAPDAENPTGKLPLPDEMSRVAGEMQGARKDPLPGKQGQHSAGAKKPAGGFLRRLFQTS